MIAKNCLVDDLKMKKEVYALEKESDEKKLIRSEAKNRHLTKVNQQLEEDSSNIEWLVKVIGDDFELKAGDYIKRYKALEKSYDKLLRSSKKEIAQLKETLFETRQERDETL